MSDDQVGLSDSDQDKQSWKILKWAWNARQEIMEKLTQLRTWFRGKPVSKDQDDEKKPGILIIGPGGAGKTTLGMLLSGEYDLLLDAVGEYNESIDIERYTLKDSPGVEIVVPPGQEHRREATWSDLEADISSGKFRGIILLASYGYHTLGQFSYKSHPLYKGNKDVFLHAYLEQRRSDELAVMRQLVPHIKVNRGKLWMLTLVTKQDLWWTDNKIVENHYREGDFSAEVKNIIGHVGQRHFRYELALASLVIANFKTGLGEPLKKNEEGYDHRQQIDSLRKLFETVDALKTWESIQ